MPRVLTVVLLSTLWETSNIPLLWSGRGELYLFLLTYHPAGVAASLTHRDQVKRFGSQVTRFLMSYTVNLHVDMGDGILTLSLMGAPQKMTHDTGLRGDRCGWKPHLPFCLIVIAQYRHQRIQMSGSALVHWQTRRRLANHHVVGVKSE